MTRQRANSFTVFGPKMGIRPRRNSHKITFILIQPKARQDTRTALIMSSQCIVSSPVDDLVALKPCIFAAESRHFRNKNSEQVDEARENEASSIPIGHQGVQIRSIIIREFIDRFWLER